jgi:hypothetical protein
MHRENNQPGQQRRNNDRQKHPGYTFAVGVRCYPNDNAEKNQCNEEFLNPVVDATEAPNDLAFEYDFGINDPVVVQEKHSRRHQLNGIHFPLQRIRIHWWAK